MSDLKLKLLNLMQEDCRIPLEKKNLKSYEKTILVFSFYRIEYPSFKCPRYCIWCKGWCEFYQDEHRQ